MNYVAALGNGGYQGGTVSLTRNTMALVLAGGRGTRLKELTERRAKPAVHFGGTARIIDFALSNALNSGIRRIGVATQYKAHSLIRHLQRGWTFLRSERNDLRYRPVGAVIVRAGAHTPDVDLASLRAAAAVAGVAMEVSVSPEDDAALAVAVLDESRDHLHHALHLVDPLAQSVLGIGPGHVIHRTLSSCRKFAGQHVGRRAGRLPEPGPGAPF